MYSKIEIVMILRLKSNFIKICTLTLMDNLKKGLQKRYNTLYYIEGRFTALPVKMIESSEGGDKHDRGKK